MVSHIQTKKIGLLMGIVSIIFVGGYMVYQFFPSLHPSETQPAKPLTDEPFAFVVVPSHLDQDQRAMVEEQIQLTKDMYNESPDIWEAWIAIGNLYTILEDYPHAIEALQQSVTMQQNNILGYRNMAEVYRTRLNDYEKAQTHYRLAIANNFIDVDLYITLARMQYKQMNKPDEAVQTLQDAMRVAQEGARKEVLVELAKVYEQSDKADKLKETVGLLLKENAKDAMLQARWSKYL